jgi:aminoglycoside phosphotransferase (APT) family kinase protein
MSTAPEAFLATGQPGVVLCRVAEQLHRTLVGWRSTAVEPTDDGYLYGYDLELGAINGAVEHRLVFVEDTPTSAHRTGVLEVPIDGTSTTLSVWLYPNDPELPALRDLTNLSLIEGILARLRISATVSGVEVVTYRPGRRAVVRVTASDRSFYLKVVEPAKAAAIAERHHQFRASSLPVPKLLGWSSDGVVAMSALPGVDAQTAIPKIQDIEEFLRQIEFLSTLLAGVPAFNTARESLFDRLDWYVDRLSSRMPADEARIAGIGAQIARCGADGRGFGFTAVTIHGDLHLGQLFVDSENPALITGMLDIDTAGVGDPADDAAAFYAHLIALAEAAAVRDPTYSAACLKLAAAWRARWPRNRNAGFDNRARAIAATHLFGHALRPLTDDANGVSHRLLDHAERLVADW